jgi:hypothetical protein
MNTQTVKAAALHPIPQSDMNEIMRTVMVKRIIEPRPQPRKQYDSLTAEFNDNYMVFRDRGINDC